MICSDIRKYVYVYLDGEFNAADQASFEDHVGQCADCQMLVRQERNFHNILRSKLQIAPAPDYLRRRIEYQLSHTEPDGSWQALLRLWSIRLAPVAMAAAIVAVVVWPRSQQSEVSVDAELDSLPVAAAVRLPQPGMGTVTLASYSQLPADVQGNEPEIANYMRQRVSFRVIAPLKQTQGLKLDGARQVMYEGRPAVLFIYSYKSQRLGVIQYKSNAVSTDELALYRDGGLTFGQMIRNGTTYVVFSEMSANELSAILNSR